MMKPLNLMLLLSMFAVHATANDSLPPTQPNVLFIPIDDLNDWEGTMGGNPQAKTPNLDKLFKQGMLFTNAHCSQAVCMASRNSLLSGIHPSTLGWYSSTTSMRKTYDQVMGEHKMLPQHFKDNGYETLAVGKVFHQGVSDYSDRTRDFWDETAPGYKVPKNLLARGDGYGGNHFYPFPKNGSQITNHYGKKFADGNSLCYGALDRDDMPGGKMFDELIADWAVEQLNRDHAKPFFLAFGFVRPHVPSRPTRTLRRIGGLGKSIFFEYFGDDFGTLDLRSLAT
jgi:arylsulfatase A-like enzyme